MNRPSLSASLGSWCVQLVYNPRSPDQGTARSPRREPVASPTWPLLLPAFGALAGGVGAGFYALAHFLTLGARANTLFFVFLLALGLSFGALCGWPWVRRLCGALRWVMVAAVMVMAAAAHSNSSFPFEIEEQSNVIVAVLVGMVMLMLISVALAGTRAGARRVPLSVPLVPCLSLFGLLCLISVDTAIQICFVIFVGTSLYLLCYEHFLRRYAPDLAFGSAPRTPSATSPDRPRPRECWRWASHALGVSGVWFAFFMAGGALLYLPVQMILPRLVPPQMNWMRAATRSSARDYRGSAPIIELHGGNYALSDREMMRVTLVAGETSGLWRGRVYERYERSRWEERSRPMSNQRNALDPRRQPFIAPRLTPVQPRHSVAPRIAPRWGRVEEVLELVEPLGWGAASIYSSGVPFTWREIPPEAPRDGTGPPTYDSVTQRPPYLVRSYVVRPRFETLHNAAGYETRRHGLGREELRANLQLPDDPETRRLLRAFVEQVKMGHKRPPGTPSEKARAVTGFLTQNAVYSLNCPAVPPTQDAVAFFLSDSRAGACDLFAASLALLLRSMNVPARVVTGYLQPELPLKSSTSPRKRATWLVRERDAHAWVEYYVPDLGWISTDPTAGTRTAATAPTKLDELLILPKFQVSPALVLPLVGLALLLLGVNWPRLEARFATSRPLNGDALARQSAIDAYLEAQRLLRRRVPSQAHLTPHEYEARVSRAPLPLAVKQEFAALTHVFIAARYGDTLPIGADELKECLARLRGHLKKQP